MCLKRRSVASVLLIILWDNLTLDWPKRSQQVRQFDRYFDDISNGERQTEPCPEHRCMEQRTARNKRVLKSQLISPIGKAPARRMTNTRHSNSQSPLPVKKKWQLCLPSIFALLSIYVWWNRPCQRRVESPRAFCSLIVSMVWRFSFSHHKYDKGNNLQCSSFSMVSDGIGKIGDLLSFNTSLSFYKLD